jgi:hypothetical protein
MSEPQEKKTRARILYFPYHMSFVRACFRHFRVNVIKSLVFFKDEWEYQDIVQSYYRGKECSLQRQQHCSHVVSILCLRTGIVRRLPRTIKYRWI